MGYKGIKVNLQLLQGSRNVIVILCKIHSLEVTPFLDSGLQALHSRLLVGGTWIIASYVDILRAFLSIETFKNHNYPTRRHIPI